MTYLKRNQSQQIRIEPNKQQSSNQRESLEVIFTDQRTFKHVTMRWVQHIKN
jgi:hypothetical protein